MNSMRVYDLTKNHVLVTRESARALATVLGSALAAGQGEVELNFEGIDGITPSFLDEILAIIEERLEESDTRRLRIVVLNPPTRLSSKFVALGRGRQLSVTESETGAWVISRSAQG